MSESPDREICLCFHVPLGKLLSFAGHHPIRVASQFSGCHGAGTGCGWCVPFLERLHEQLAAGETPDLGMTPEEYRRLRIEYHRTKKPMIPPPADADGPIELDIEDLLDQMPEEEKFDRPEGKRP